MVTRQDLMTGQDFQGPYWHGWHLILVCFENVACSVDSAVQWLAFADVILAETAGSVVGAKVAAVVDEAAREYVAERSVAATLTLAVEDLMVVTVSEAGRSPAQG